MRHFMAIICFAAFFTLQYSKVISYWHCRLSAISEAARCDCERLLLSDAQLDNTEHSSAIALAKTFTEESYCFDDILNTYQVVPAVTKNHFPCYQQFIPEGTMQSIFQPPRL